MERRSVIGIASADAMEALGAACARGGRRGQCLYLHGPLAAGKTTFARGYVRALGHRGAVKSPTFTLVESYVLAAASVHHFDLYRLADAEELEFIGIEEYLEGGADVLVEWAERGTGVLPPATIDIDIGIVSSGREVALESHDDRGLEIVSSILKAFKSDG
ncbi:MAG: tRNA (adenosine(37)-N6)-threonylcarbamoyltransferase complex ATPase subunit type 1 TsaE [Gammaproteobacteria bacterium]